MELQRRLERADAKNLVARHRSSALIFFCVSLTIHNYSLGSRTVIWWKVCDYGKTLQRFEIRGHKGIISMRNKMQAHSPKFHSSAPSSWWKVAWLSCILSGKRNNLRESFYALDDPLEQSCICPLVRFTLFLFLRKAGVAVTEYCWKHGLLACQGGLLLMGFLKTTPHQ